MLATSGLVVGNTQACCGQQAGLLLETGTAFGPCCDPRDQCAAMEEIHASLALRATRREACVCLALREWVTCVCTAFNSLHWCDSAPVKGADPHIGNLCARRSPCLHSCASYCLLLRMPRRLAERDREKDQPGRQRSSSHDRNDQTQSGSVPASQPKLRICSATHLSCCS